ncbi:hypothetical protein HDU77_010680, partial [Chytriomyces hyalinus]
MSLVNLLGPDTPCPSRVSLVLDAIKDDCFSRQSKGDVQQWTKADGLLLSELLLSLRAIIVRAKEFPHLQRDVATPTIQKLFTWLLQKVASSESNADIVHHALTEYIVLGSVFPSMTKPFTDKIEAICVQTLSSENVSPRLQAQAIKALVVANRVIVNKAKNIANNGSEKDAAMAASASSKLTESLLAIVKQLVSVGSSGMDVHYVSKSQPYFKDMEGSYLTMLAPLLDRFKALIKCHLYLLGSRGEKSDAINPRLMITIAGLIFDNAGGDKAKFGHHDAIYTDNLHLIMPTLVGWINRLLVSLISSLGQQMLPDRDSLWILIRKSFAYSSKSVPARISTYRLVTVFIETFGINGADSIYLGVMEDAVRDLAVSNEHVMSRSAASLVIASGKCLGAILTYASPQQFNNQSLSTLYSNVVKAMLSFVVDAKSMGSQPFRGSVQLAYAKLIVKCLQCHARDAYPMEWVASGMRSLVVAVAAADAELKPRLEELIHAHSDVLFGYRPVISRTVIPDTEEANPVFGGTYAQGGVTGGRIYASVQHSEIDSEKYDAHDHQAQTISAN